jgi:hypothetical protein
MSAQSYFVRGEDQAQQSLLSSLTGHAPLFRASRCLQSEMQTARIFFERSACLDDTKKAGRCDNPGTGAEK